MGRHAPIDLCRGLLFALMANTHALQLAGVPSSHWLRSDLWLPNGWATVVFVVLSGYGAGYIFSVRQPVAERDRALRHRGGQILLVMLGSNLLFAALRDMNSGSASTPRSLDWWLGFLTLETAWTISGVLLPTGLVLLVAPWVIRHVQHAPWKSLGQGMLLSALVSAWAIWISGTEVAGSWLARVFLIEGLGGFPVLPFLVNGCFGIWLGILHRRSPYRWHTALVVLMAVQGGVYLSTFLPPDPWLSGFRASLGALGKFGWMFAVALCLTSTPLHRLAAPVEKIGRFALGSFVMHRVFLQVLALGMGVAGVVALPPGAAYVVLFSGTMLLTWTLCLWRERVHWVDAFFRRLAM